VERSGWDNVECRNQNDERNPNPEIRIGWADRVSGMPPRLHATKAKVFACAVSACSCFGIRDSVVILVSSFEFERPPRPPRTRGNEGTSDTYFRVDPKSFLTLILTTRLTDTTPTDCQDNRSPLRETASSSNRLWTDRCPMSMVEARLPTAALHDCISLPSSPPDCFMQPPDPVGGSSRRPVSKVRLMSLLETPSPCHRRVLPASADNESCHHDGPPRLVRRRSPR